MIERAGCLRHLRQLEAATTRSPITALLGPRQPYPVDAGITVLPIAEVVDLRGRIAGL